MEQKPKKDAIPTKNVNDIISYPIFENPQEYLQFREGSSVNRFFKRTFEYLSLDRCLKGIQDITSVYDCPCGPGRLFAYWKKKGYEITGIDLSSPMLDAAENELKNIRYAGKTLFYDIFKLTDSGIEQPDMVACIRFIYYFDADIRIRLLKSFAQFSKKYVLVQYKTAETLRGQKNARLATAKRGATAKHFNTYREIIDEFEQAGLKCLRIVPKGDNSDRVFVLAQRKKTPQRIIPADCSRRPYIFKHRKLLAQVAAIVAVSLLVIGALQSNRLWDPHEYAIECLVESYQDGDDVFFVNSDSDFEDLRTDDDLVVVSHLTSAIENILKNNNSQDCYFLIPVNEFNLVKNKPFSAKLKVIRNLSVGNDRLVLLSTEEHPPHRNLSIDTYRITSDKYFAFKSINFYRAV